MLRNTKLAAIVMAASFVFSGSQIEAQIFGRGKAKQPQQTVKFPGNNTAGNTGLTITNPRLNPVNKNGQDLRGYPDGAGRYGIKQSSRFGTNVRHLFSSKGASGVQPDPGNGFVQPVPTPAPRREAKRISNTYVAPPSSSSFANVPAKTELQGEKFQAVKNPFYSILKFND